MKEPEILYKRKGINAPILWEKTYYQDEFIGGTKTDPFQGTLFLFRFLILQGKIKNRFLIEPIVDGFKSNSQQEVDDALVKKIGDMQEWILKGKDWKNADFFPEEVNQKLLEFNLEKYVKN